MDDTPEVIRQQMDETMSHLSEKLETLENQVSETVQSTGTAVNATVEAVQETVETVTGAVQGAVQSVSNAFDLRRQLARHPYLVLGGAALLGYLAAKHLSARSDQPARRPAPVHPPSPSADNASDGNGAREQESAAMASALAAAFQAGLDSSFWSQLKGQATITLLGVMQDIVTRAVPLVMDRLDVNRPHSGNSGNSDQTNESSGSPRGRESSCEQ